MDNWPGWHMKMRTKEEIQAVEQEVIVKSAWSPAMKPGLVFGVIAGICFYFLIVA